MEQTIGSTGDAAPRLDLSNDKANYDIQDPIQNEIEA